MGCTLSTRAVSTSLLLSTAVGVIAGTGLSISRTRLTALTTSIGVIGATISTALCSTALLAGAVGVVTGVARAIATRLLSRAVRIVAGVTRAVSSALLTALLAGIVARNYQSQRELLAGTCTRILHLSNFLLEFVHNVFSDIRLRSI